MTAVATTTRQAAPAPARKAPPTIKERLQSPDFALEVSKVLPKHLTPERMVKTALMALTRTPKLATADQYTFFLCLMQCSALGLEPDGRKAHLIPFENRKRGVTEVQLIIDYKGLVELVMRSGQVSNIHADVVCENDVFEFDRGLVTKHSYKLGQPRGEPIGVYAMARFKDGSEKAEVMGWHEVMRIRDRSQGWMAFKNGYAKSSPWETDEGEMAKKTGFRRLSKWIPMSVEVMDALAADADTEEARFERAKPAVVGGPAVLPFPDLAPPSEEDPKDPEPEADPRTPDPEPDAPEGEPVMAPETPPPAVARKSSFTAPMDALAAFCGTAGIAFDEFQRWGVSSGNAPQADSWAGFEDVPPALATRLLRAKAGMRSQIEAARGGTK